MEVSPNALRKETVQLLNQINKQIEEVETLAASRDRAPSQMVDQYGSYLMSPLLLAKSQCIHTLTLLSGQGRK
jgi:hypothetical protein